MDFKAYILSESIRDLITLGSKLANMSRSEVESYLADQGMMIYFDRMEFVKNFSWSIPCEEAIEAFRKYARPPLIDMMAGTGFWAKILSERGIRVIPYDIHSSKRHNLWQKSDDKKSMRSHLKPKRSPAYRTMSQVLNKNKRIIEI